MPSKTPIEALFLETGCIPLKFHIQKRRLMYLHHLLTRSEKELIRKFYSAQKSKPSKNDWVQTVKSDLESLKIDMNDEEISKISKNKFSKIAKKIIVEKSFEYLIEEKNKHSKMEET